MAVSRNRLDENKGTFGPFVAGQKDEENRLLHADSRLKLKKAGGMNLRLFLPVFIQFYRSYTLFIFVGLQFLLILL